MSNKRASKSNDVIRQMWERKTGLYPQRGLQNIEEPIVA
jgi:hypothetical protein